jgi:hypothetical protein
MRASPKETAFVGMALFPKKNRPKAVKKIEVILVRGMVGALLPRPMHGPISTLTAVAETPLASHSIGVGRMVRLHDHLRGGIYVDSDCNADHLAPLLVDAARAAGVSVSL